MVLVIRREIAKKITRTTRKINTREAPAVPSTFAREPRGTRFKRIRFVSVIFLAISQEPGREAKDSSCVLSRNVLRKAAVSLLPRRRGCSLESSAFRAMLL